ncbi:MAG TPA: NAD(P)-dependent oxidoreductase [Kofleriaceae bacterium]|nr:NAD(P)-dependent oxidoreductase [Kofleriaceae bacterium]
MLYVHGRKVVVVGDAHATAERVSRLRDAGATAVVVTPDAVREETFTGAFAVLAMGASAADNARAVTLARRAGCLVYAHDQPSISDFAMPALTRRGPLQIAIATDGIAPALSRRLRQELSRILDAAGPRLDRLIARLADIRARPADDARRAELSRVAAALHLDGALEIDESAGE